MALCQCSYISCAVLCSAPQLQFEKGDLITVTKKVEGGWWEGVCSGKVGWFPGNYVEEFSGGECVCLCVCVCVCVRV